MISDVQQKKKLQYKETGGRRKGIQIGVLKKQTNRQTDRQKNR